MAQDGSRYISPTSECVLVCSILGRWQGAGAPAFTDSWFRARVCRCCSLFGPEVRSGWLLLELLDHLQVIHAHGIADCVYACTVSLCVHTVSTIY